MKPKNHVTPWLLIALCCCFAACVGDFLVTFILGWLYDGYSWLEQSQSFLGTGNSPVAPYMNAWGVVFSLLFVGFAYALHRTVLSKGLWPGVAVWLIVFYGLGEGIGSGLFPYNHTGGTLTLSGKLHSLFSGMGEIAIVLLPFVLRRIISRQLYPRLHAYSLFVALSGPVLIVVFLLARQGIVPLRGLWQRLFILDYYSLLVAFALTIWRYPFTPHGAGTVPVNVDNVYTG